MSRHLCIAGPGRAGTSFLVSLLGELGVSTHLEKESGSRDWSEVANAGYEDILSDIEEKYPYVVKSPLLHLWIESALQKGFEIDGVIIPIRPLTEAAMSRVVVDFSTIYRQHRWMLDELDTWYSWGPNPGGGSISMYPIDQARIISMATYMQLEILTRLDIPFVTVSFPKIIVDPKYLFRQISRFLPQIEYFRFCEVHSVVADVDRVRIAQLPTEVSAQTAEIIALRREAKMLRETVHEKDLRISELATRIDEIGGIVDIANLPIDFDRRRYLEINRDVATSGIDPIEHYLRFGMHEGRRYI